MDTPPTPLYDRPIPTLRAACDSDLPAIYAVHRAAFGGHDEADIIAAFARSGAATASWVATDGPDLVAHLLFSPVAIDGPDGRAAATGLAPLGVLPSHQRTGLGTALVRHGLADLPPGPVVVLGDPAYYNRFGFQPARDFGLTWEVPGHDDHLMVLGSAIPAGVVRYRPEVMGHQVSPATDLAALQSLERLAAKRFRHSPHPHLAEATPLSLERLATLPHDGLWTLSTRNLPLAAFVAWEARGPDAYLIELNVHPEAAGARFGAALIDHVALLARRQGLSRLVLRTFADVPWNAPYYRRLGFTPIEPPTTLADVLAAEEAAGLSARLTMARPA